MVPYVFLSPSFPPSKYILSLFVCFTPSRYLEVKRYTIDLCLHFCVNKTTLLYLCLQKLRASIASTYYADLGIQEDDIFVSDGAKSDISRLQVFFLVLALLVFKQFSGFYFVIEYKPLVVMYITHTSLIIILILFDRFFLDRM